MFSFTFTEEGSRYQQSELLVDKMLDNLLHKIKVEMESPTAGTDKQPDGKALKDFLVFFSYFCFHAGLSKSNSIL
jgi:hypothetical protein